MPSLGTMADEFATALETEGCSVRRITVPDRNHNSVMFLAIEARDAVGKAIVDFVALHSPAPAVAE